MREMGRKGGLKGGQKGGKVRMAALKPEERKELARKAADKRWQKPCRPPESPLEYYLQKRETQPCLPG